MITINNLEKKYHNNEEETIAKSSLHFKNNGLYFLLGKSGCGKSTFVNILTGLDTEFEGEILFNDIALEKLSEEEMRTFRRENVSYIFQEDFLDEFLSVEENIRVVLENLVIDRATINRKVEEVSLKLGINALLKQQVRKLSGGEKSRVKIARAIIKPFSLLIADEPTANLDNSLADAVYKILKSISEEKVVIFITHEERLVDNNENVIRFSHKKIIMNESKISCHKEKRENIFVAKRWKLTHIIRRVIKGIRKNKIRNCLIIVSQTIAFFSIALSFLITSIATNMIATSYKDLFNENTILISPKKETVLNDELSSLNIVELQNIEKGNNKISSDSGFIYESNFEENFAERNRFSFQYGLSLFTFPRVGIRNFNEFLMSSEVASTTKYYPFKPTIYQDNEISLGLSKGEKDSLCELFDIESSYQELGDYFSTHPLGIKLELSNSTWNYHFSKTFTLIAIFEAENNIIVNNDNMFNQYLFEKEMKLDVSQNLESSLLYPWSLRKKSYIRILSSSHQNYLNKLSFDASYQDLLFTKSYDYNFHDKIVGDYQRIYVYHKTIRSFDFTNLNFLLQKHSGLKYGLNDGYSFMNSSLIQGFTKAIFVSSDKWKLNKLEDANSLNMSLMSNYNGSMIVPGEGIVKGDITRSGKEDNLNFKSLGTNKLKYGVFPQSTFEVVISSGLAKKLFSLEDVVKEKLFFTNYKNSRYDGERIINEFVNGDFTVSGIIEDESLSLYQDSYWPIEYFRDIIELTPEQIEIKSIFINAITANIKEEVFNLNKQYKNYHFSAPLDDIISEVNNMLSYYQMGMILFGALICIISTILLFFANYLNFKEKMKTIGLYEALGFKKSDVNKYILTNGMFLSLCSLLQTVFIIIAINMQYHLYANLSTMLLSITIISLLAITINLIAALIILLYKRKISTLTLLRG